MEWIKDFMESPFLDGWGFLIGVIGLLSSYVFYRINLKDKKPSWAIDSNNLVKNFSNRIENVEVTYKSKSVENLTISKVVFWNSGKGILNRTDIASSDWLRVIVKPDVQILEAQLLESNNAPSLLDCSLHPDGRELMIDFEYLDYNQGGIFQIIHTGTSSRDLKILGTVKGAKITKKRIFDQKSLVASLVPPPLSERMLNNYSRKSIRLLNVVFVFFGVAFYVAIGYVFLTESPSLIVEGQLDPQFLMGWIFLGLGGLLLIMFSFLFRRSLPPGLEGIDDFG